MSLRKLPQYPALWAGMNGKTIFVKLKMILSPLEAKRERVTPSVYIRIITETEKIVPVLLIRAINYR